MTITRGDALDMAKDLVVSDRAAEYGPFSDNARRIAGLWSAYLDTTIDPADVGPMLALLKIARIGGEGPHNADSYIDACGYLSLACELVETRENG